MSDTPERVEKLMALTMDDFHRSMKTLAPGIALADDQTEIVIPADASQVRIVYEALEKATLGGLLSLPRARVTLLLDELDETRRQTFLRSFDRAFQRGGG